MIKVTINGRDAVATTMRPITSGSVGIPVEFNFSNDWDDMTKIAVFRGSGTAADVALLTNECVVPWETVTQSGDNLWVGVYGASGDGETIVPTIWAKVGHIYDGTELSSVDPSEPTPSWVAQVQSAVEDALETAQSVRDDADEGEFDGFSPVITVTDITGGHEVTIEDAGGTHTFNVPNGFSPSVSVSTISGGHRVSVTDSDGTETFDVMDGEDGAPGQDGAQGETGPAGPGVAAGGTTGQYLKKKSGTDYDTEWATLPTEAYWATYGTTTSAQIEAAYQAGKAVLCMYGDKVYLLTSRSSSTKHLFTSFFQETEYMLTCNSNTWSTDSLQLAKNNSPQLIGTPKAPTAAYGTDTTQIATTAFVQDAVEGTHQVPSGGTSGQVLAKASGTDYDLEWVNQSGGGGTDEIFVAEYNVTTYADLLTAQTAGKLLFCKYGSEILNLYTYNSDDHVFTFRTYYSGIYYARAQLSQADGWYYGYVGTTLGNIDSNGDISGTGATIAAGDRLVINDESASKLDNSSITFGSDSTKYLANDGTWQSVPGGGGGTSDYSDLTNKPSINNVTLSGNKTASDLGLAAASDIPTVPDAATATPSDLGTAAVGSSSKYAKEDHVHKMPSASDVGAYVKPSGGIPSTDLASGVQTSLGKADTAYQKPSGGIPSTDLASGVIPSVPSPSSATPQNLGTAAAGSSTDYSRADHIHALPTASDIGAYVKPSGGIPATDLASGVIPEDEIFVAVYDTTSYNDVLAAYNEGKIIICKSGDRYSLLKSYSSNTFNFYTLSSLTMSYRYSVNSSGWSSGSISVASPSAATATPSDLGVAAVGTSTKYAREDHVHNKPTYTASDVGAIAAPSSPSSGQYLKYNGSAWAADNGPSIPTAYTSNPAALGTASAGSSTSWAKGDHVHPKPSAADLGVIAAPSSPTTGQFLKWSGTAWVASDLPVYSGGVT